MKPPRRLGRGVVLGGLLAVAAAGGLRAGLEAVWRTEETHEAALRLAHAAGRREGNAAIRERAARALAHASSASWELRDGARGRLDRIFLCAELKDAWDVLREAARQEVEAGPGSRGAVALADLDARFEATYGRARRLPAGFRVCNAVSHFLPRLRAVIEEPELVPALGDWIHAWQVWVDRDAGRRPSGPDRQGELLREHARELEILQEDRRKALRALRDALGVRARFLSATTALALVEVDLRSIGQTKLADELGAEAAVELARATHLLATQPRQEPVAR